MQNNNVKGRTDQRVLIFPALTSGEMSEKQVYFLFSVSQVEDIIKEMQIHPVPFSPPYTEGIAQWRDHVVPVISLEKCLNRDSSSLKSESTKENTRLIMVRSRADEDKVRRGALRVIPPIRMFSLPIPCTPVSSVKWITKENLVRGVYEWDEGYIVVPYLRRILDGDLNPEFQSELSS